MIKRILVLEDDLSLSQIIAEFLEKKGYQVQVVHNGKEGLKILENNEFDFIICDVEMPIMGGREFFQKILQKGVMTPFQFVTGNEGFLEDTFFQNLDRELLIKPYDLHVLFKRIENS